MKVISIVFLLFAFACANAADAERELPELSGLYDKCELNKAKSVVISDSKAVYDEKLKPFNFVNFDQGISWDYRNVDAPSFLPSEGGNVSLSVSGSSFNETYQLWKLKFVNQNEDQGSRHVVDGVSYPVELHLVSVNKQLKSFVVSVFFFKQVQEENVALRELLDVFSKNKTVFQWKLSSLLPPVEELKDYYRYDGKSSNSSCVDDIKWTVFEKPIPVSVEQLKVFVSEVAPKSNFVVENVSLREVYSSKKERRVVKESEVVPKFETKGVDAGKTETKTGGEKATVQGTNTANGMMTVAYSSLFAVLGLNLLFL